MGKKNPLEGFENKSRLLSEDEQQLVQVLSRFYEHITSLSERVASLENEVEALRRAAGASLIIAQKAH